MQGRSTTDWRLRTRTLTLGARTLVMGVVNITPDSFSDGGRYFSPEAAVEHALRLLDEGADLLDLGAESTRPERSMVNATVATPVPAAPDGNRLWRLRWAISAPRQVAGDIDDAMPSAGAAARSARCA